MSLTTAKLKATLRRNEPAGVKILKILRIANCMKYLRLYAGLQNELPNAAGSVRSKYVPNECDHGSNSDTVARSRRSTNRVEPAQIPVQDVVIRVKRFDTA